MSDHLSDLLGRRADQAQAVRPSLDGVHAVVARRRRRRRAVGTATAALCLVAGITGGLVLAGGDDDSAPPVATEPSLVDDLPFVGIDLPGFVRAPGLEAEARSETGGVDQTYAVFTGDGVDLLGPMITASFQPGEVQLVGSPVDLDQDGDDSGAADGRMISVDGGDQLTFAADGGTASIVGQGVPIEDVIIYAKDLVGLPFDLDQMPAPERLPNRQVVSFRPPDFASRIAVYQGPTAVIHVVATTEAGYLDLTRIVSTEGAPYERIGFQSSWLGPGEAILSPDDDGPVSALVRTDAGLTVHVFGERLDPDTLRAAIEQDHLVDLTGTEPTTTTATTEAPDTTTTAPVPASTTSAVPPTTELSLRGIERSVTDETETIDLEFDNGIPVHRNLTMLEHPAGECAALEADFEEEWRGFMATEPSWNGWITLELEADVIAIRGPVFSSTSESGYLLCGDGPPPTTIAIPVESLGEPTVIELSGRPVLRIEVPLG